jgi:hypothetical protein
MEEIDMYTINKWVGVHSKDWFGKYGKTELYSSLSHNPHPMAVNTLYANIDFLNKHFVTFFYVKKETLFLHEKLKKTGGFTQYQNANYYQHTKMENDIKNLSSMREGWKYFYAITHVCERPLKEIMVPFDDLNWYHLSANRNKCVIDFLKLHPDKVIWRTLAMNPCDAAVDLLLEERRNGREIIWQTASRNPNERIISLFGDVKSQLCMTSLSQNIATSAVQFLLSECYDRINWEWFCENPNDLAVDHIMDILEKDSEDKRIVWECLSTNTNPRVFAILEANQSKIDWFHFVKNPICFAYDYEKIRERFAPLKQEIQDIFLHPDNVMARIEMEKTEGETDFDIVSRLDFN